MEKGKQFPWFIVVIFIVGVIISSFLVLTQTNAFFKQDHFTKKIILDADKEQDGGYILLIRDERTPSALDWAKFENGANYIFFSLSNNEVLEKKVTFVTPDLERGQYFVGYEIEYLSGKSQSSCWPDSQ